MMIRWWEHSQKGVTDRRTDRRTENTICRAAWSQLKIHFCLLTITSCQLTIDDPTRSDNKANLRDLIAATGLVILLTWDSNRRFFGPCDLEIWPMTLKNNRASILWYFKLCASFHSHYWIQTGVRVWKRSIRVKIVVFLPVWPWIWLMTLKNNRAPLLCYFKLCASFHSHQWIQTGVRVRKRSIRVKIIDFLARVTFKFNWWPWKSIGNLSYATSSFVHHLIAISEFKLELRVRKRSIRVKIGHFLAHVTLKFYRWPSKTIGHLSHATSSFVHHFIVISEFKLELESGNAQFGSKSSIFWPLWLWNLTNDLEKQQGTSPLLLQALWIISWPSVYSNWS